MLPETLEIGMTVAYTRNGKRIEGVYIGRSEEGWREVAVHEEATGAKLLVILAPETRVEPLGWASGYVAEMAGILNVRSVALNEADRRVVALTRDKERLERALGARFVDRLALEVLEDKVDVLKQSLYVMAGPNSATELLAAMSEAKL